MLELVAKQCLVVSKYNYKKIHEADIIIISASLLIIS